MELVRTLVEEADDEDTMMSVHSTVGRLLLTAEVGEIFVIGQRGKKAIVKVLRVE
jgi:transcription elongation GreA/GreB family factor